MANEQRKFGSKKIGPGGMNCTCCGPKPGQTRKEFLRSVKRGEKHIAKQHIHKEILEHELQTES